MRLSRVYGTGRHEDKSITFGADPEILLHDYDAYEKYVKACEHTVRKDDRYTHYVGKLRTSGFDHCAVLGNVLEHGDKVELEMHHGPIFNLFDICDIVLKAELKRQRIPDLCTFDIGDLVLAEHEKDHIMVVMLSTTAHKAAHKNLFIDIKATVGRIDKFIDSYYDGMEAEHFRYIDQYIKACEDAEGKTNDQALFDTADMLRRFK